MKQAFEKKRDAWKIAWERLLGREDWDSERLKGTQMDWAVALETRNNIRRLKLDTNKINASLPNTEDTDLHHVTVR